MAKRKEFYSVICKDKVVGISEQSGFEIKIDGEIFNAYRSKDKGRAYIIDPKTGIAVYTYEYPWDEMETPSETGMIKRAREKLAEDKERLEKWRQQKSKKTRCVAN